MLKFGNLLRDGTRVLHFMPAEKGSTDPKDGQALCLSEFGPIVTFHVAKVVKDELGWYSSGGASYDADFDAAFADYCRLTGYAPPILD